MSVIDLVKQLRREVRTSAADYETALDTAATIITNILEKPEEEKFRTVRLSNATFHRRLGQFPAGLSLLRELGFEDARGDGDSSSAAAAYLACPVADAALLAQGLIVVKAAREASTQVSAEQSGAVNQPAAAAAPAAPAAPAAAAAPAASTSLSRAHGKRPLASGSAAEESQADAKRAAVAGGSGGGTSSTSCGASATAAASGGADTTTSETVANADELGSYCASDIDTHFLTQCGGAFLEGVGREDGEKFARLVATARDARRVAAATADVDAEATAARWVALLEEHGALLGWEIEEVGEEDEEEEEVAAAAAGPSAHEAAAGPSAHAAAADGGGSSSSGVNAGAGGSSSSRGDAGGGDAGVEVIADDGNFDTCAVCEGGGLLFCCEACPQAYHAACLGDQAPPEDDDDAAWFCPPCAHQLGLSTC